LTPVARLIFETKKRAIFLERFFICQIRQTPAKDAESSAHCRKQHWLGNASRVRVVGAIERSKLLRADLAHAPAYRDLAKYYRRASLQDATDQGTACDLYCTAYAGN